jgi:integrase
VTPIAYRERLKLQQRSPYALKEASERLRDEWMFFVAYKVEAGSGGRGRLRRAKSGMWAKTAQPVKPQSESNWFAFQRNYYVATADAKWSMVSQYIGWLMLDVAKGGMGMAGDAAMTLANFARDDLLRHYQEWRIERSGGTSHQGILSLLKFVASLCHPETGYLTQSWGQFQEFARAPTIEEWLLDCQYAYEYVKNLGNDLQALGGKSRNSFEPIKVALDLPNPLDAVADAVLRMDANRPSTGGLHEAVWARDRLLLKLLASNPLRDKNARMLTYLADGSGHLHKKDGVWRIAIPKNEFKNFRGAASDRDYDMPVRPEVWPDIERYLRDYRPLLASGDTPYVFVSNGRGDRPWHRLRRQFEALTCRYLEGCPGVGPHAMRHLVATSILKQRPNDWAAAAWALHDREDTVRKHYAHLRSDDAYRWLDAAMAGPFGRM